MCTCTCRESIQVHVYLQSPPRATSSRSFSPGQEFTPKRRVLDKAWQDDSVYRVSPCLSVSLSLCLSVSLSLFLPLSPSLSLSLGILCMYVK